MISSRHFQRPDLPVQPLAELVFSHIQLVLRLYSHPELGRVAEEAREALGAAMESAGGPAGPEQVSEMNRLQSGLMKAYRLDFALLVVSMVAMAVARYL